MRLNSIRFKISILFSFILFVVLCIFGLFELHSVRKNLYESEAESLLVKAKHIDNFIDAYSEMNQNEGAFSIAQILTNTSGDHAVIDELWDKDSRSMGLGNDFYRLISLQGKVILRSGQAYGLEQMLNEKFPLSTKTQYQHFKVKDKNFYALNYMVIFANQVALILQVATPTDNIEKVMRRQMGSFVLGIVIMLIVTVFIGSLLTKEILKPVMVVIKTANQISSTNLSKRIPHKELDHEMESLVSAFNGMIERLEKSFSYVKDFNSHIAHELKTPLAIIKGELELALSKPQSVQESQRVMHDSLEEVNRLIRIIKDLLLIARFEYNADSLELERLELNQFLKNIHEQTAVLIGEKHILFEFQPSQKEAYVMANPAHLKRVFINLIHNAIKFTPDGGMIQVSLTSEKERSVSITVKDNGQGIAAADHEKVFEKFFRSRQNNDGTGLGLSMAKAIVKAHSGDISLESSPGQGASFKVVLPAVN